MYARKNKPGTNVISNSEGENENTIEIVGRGIRSGERSGKRTDDFGARKAEMVEENAISSEDSSYTLKMKDIPAEKRPREMLLKLGAEKLTTPQLLAIVLRTGNAREDVMQLAERLYLNYSMNELARAGASELSRTLGVGNAKACQIIASLELGKRILNYESKPVFTRPSEAAFFLLPELSGLQQEHFKCLYLNRKNRLVSDRTLFVGTHGESLVDPGPILREALINHASSIILSHNHPSGDPTPSSNDIEITKRIFEAGRLLGIEVFDHIIIGNDSFVSLAEKGLMPD